MANKFVYTQRLSLSVLNSRRIGFSIVLPLLYKKDKYHFKLFRSHLGYYFTKHDGGLIVVAHRR